MLMGRHAKVTDNSASIDSFACLSFKFSDETNSYELSGAPVHLWGAS